MDVTRLDETDAERLTGPIFETQVHRKAGPSEEFGDHGVSMSEIFFAPGERTAMHEHTVRQILYVTEGEGILASEDEKNPVSEGDIISIPPDEPHWHGAKPNATFAHLSFVILDENGEGSFAVEEPEGRRSE
ncbi:cupin domain-containing protein [Halorussus amylolyticus]|uniref:cupin domain-containing protein n=1 Tax=Halorussus amylolyticus TaxID=1126242 RepID=UPI0010491296|nr:cupin domain-containing protein [Halorussus amylolyticus]